MNIKMYRTTLIILTLLASTIFRQDIYASDQIVDEESLTNWGYKTITSGENKQTDWEISEFGNATIHLQKIKAINEVPGWPNAFYRFTITSEKYNSESNANKRLKKLYKTPPNINTKMHPEYVLREGFRKVKYVYIISTDVLKFEIEELPHIFELLKVYINTNRP